MTTGIGPFLGNSQRAGIRRVAILIAIVLTAVPVEAQVSHNGGEFQVNSYTTNGQVYPAIDTNNRGELIVVWHGDGSSGSDTSASSIHAQRFDANGIPLGSELQVNTFTTSVQLFPAVATNPQGDFVVVWASDGSDGTDTSGDSIQGQRFDAGGLRLGDQFQINSYTTSDQWRPAADSDAQGHLVVVWQSRGSGGTDTSYTSIQSQRFDADGLPLGGQVQVNTFTTGFQSSPSVSSDPQGNFVVVWRSEGSDGTDTGSWSIQARRFDVDAVPMGDQFQVNTYTTGNQRYPDVATAPQGGFVVAWQSLGSGGTDTSSESIQARRFDVNGIPFAGDMQVNTYTTSIQRNSRVAIDERGDFVVAWQSLGSGGTDSAGNGILAQRFLADGSPLGGEFQVNSYTTGDQRYPAVAADAGGNLSVTWQSYPSGGLDTSSYSIQAQRFDDLFRDGCESGDTTRWSLSVP